MLDSFKELGFHFATEAGITISKNDVVAPPDKEEILERYESETEEIMSQYDEGYITAEERKEAVTSRWDSATEEVGQAMEDNLDKLNPIYMMAHSGARGSFKQIRQLAGMRGLMANPKGEIIERPIKANFMEGLSVLEYFISTHGARKGLADTALRTADSGYLTRRLVDVAQDVIVRIDDCKTKDFVEMPLYRDGGELNPNLIGRVAAKKSTTKRGRELLKRDQLIDWAELAGASPRASRSDEDADGPGSLGAQVRGRVRGLPPVLRRHARDRLPWWRSGTRSGSSPRSRSASRARSSPCGRSTPAVSPAWTSPRVCRESSSSSRRASRRAWRRSPRSPARSRISRRPTRPSS